jgi:hypothetical protein
MTKIKNSKQYGLEERTLRFAKEVIEFVKNLPKTIANIEIIKQLVRASGSVGANYLPCKIDAKYTSRNFYNILKLKDFFEAVVYCLAPGILECWNNDFTRKSLI